MVAICGPTDLDSRDDLDGSHTPRVLCKGGLVIQDAGTEEENLFLAGR